MPPGNSPIALDFGITVKSSGVWDKCYYPHSHLMGPCLYLYKELKFGWIFDIAENRASANFGADWYWYVYFTASHQHAAQHGRDMLRTILEIVAIQSYLFALFVCFSFFVLFLRLGLMYPSRLQTCHAAKTGLELCLICHFCLARAGSTCVPSHFLSAGSPSMSCHLEGILS